MSEVIGKISWITDKPVEFPKESGKFNLPMKINNIFYNKFGEVPKLKVILDKLKAGYEVKLDVDGTKINKIEVLNEVESITPEPQIPTPTEALTKTPIKKRNENIIQISGKDFMTYKGLLELAHKKKKSFSIVILESFVSEDMTKCWCKVRLTSMTESDENITFDGFGSSTPDNTGVMTATHPIEMAHTRAKGRALRDYLNIGEAMAEEIR